MADRLFTPLRVGHAQLAHRMVMAPLTRFRADDKHVPSPHAKEYYEQRASVRGTLEITEATFISSQAGGYPGVPGIWSDAQVAGWKDVVDAVHKKGSFIFLQLWALGRTAQQKVLEADGHRLRGPSAISFSSGETQSPVPEVLTEEEIQSFIRDYADAARNAIEAGFDGVEIHGANGYLVDQFLQDVSNQRTDAYGGSIENRARFGLEVTRAVIAAVGNDSKKVGIRLSPWGNFQGMLMDDPIPQFTYMVQELRKLDLAYLHLTEKRISGAVVDAVYAGEHGETSNEPFIETWEKDAGPVILAGGFTPETAKKVVEKHENLAVAFGRHFISTPDLPFRAQHGIPLNEYNRDTFYTPGPVGYVDYPFSDDFLAKESRL